MSKNLNTTTSYFSPTAQSTGRIDSSNVCCLRQNLTNKLTVKLTDNPLQSYVRPRQRRSYGGCMVRMEGGEGSGQGKVVTGGAGISGEDVETNVKVSEMLRLLNRQLTEATAKEDYTEAAKVRDLMKTLEEKDPALQLQKLLTQAIAEERYADAADYRDKLKQIAPPEVEEPKSVSKCNSNSVTKGVRVIVRSIYVRDRSTPSRQQFFFAYRVRVSNEGTRPVQLLNRHWVITDANGRVEEVRGPGVIGEQPILKPGASFEYTSACPLRTPSGTMEGEYEMIYSDDVAPNPFEVKVGPFGLNVNDDSL